MPTNKQMLATLFVAGLLGCWGYRAYHVVLFRPVVNTPVTVEIEKGDSLNDITRKLEAQNVNFSPFWFKAIGVQKHALRKLKTGVYELNPGLTLPELIEKLVLGKSKQYTITFPEGWRFKDMLSALEQHPDIKHTIGKPDNEKIMAQFGGTVKNPEGQFFPDTYFFDKNASDISILSRAYAKMQEVLAEEWRTKADKLPVHTEYEALILASIVEKETADKTERPQIAGVFSRRLKTGMRLQTDPTVIYGIGDNYDGDLKSKDLTTLTAYNTYMINGLPPTPIAMPGRSAIQAALHPDNSKALYFVAKGDGSHVFSATLDEHKQAVSRYQGKKNAQR